MPREIRNHMNERKNFVVDKLRSFVIRAAFIGIELKKKKNKRIEQKIR